MNPYIVVNILAGLTTAERLRLKSCLSRALDIVPQPRAVLEGEVLASLGAVALQGVGICEKSGAFFEVGIPCKSPAIMAESSFSVLSSSGSMDSFSPMKAISTPE